MLTNIAYTFTNVIFPFSLAAELNSFTSSPSSSYLKICILQEQILSNIIHQWECIWHDKKYGLVLLFPLLLIIQMLDSSNEFLENQAKYMDP